MTQDPVRSVKLEWTGDAMRFRGGGTRPETPPIDIDGDNAAAPGPMLVLLLAMAGCTGADIVHVLGKMRVELTELSIEVEGVRRDEDPRRYDSLHLKYRIRGRGLDDSKAERAVSLSVDKYCSVMHTLAPDIAVSYAVEAGEPEAGVTQG